MNKARILVVEDEIIIAMEIADRLKEMGYEIVRIVPDSEMALKTAIEQKPDLILMDIMLPGNVDGIETTAQIHAKIDIPVIYLTANADSSTLERAKSSDAFGYLIKPFEEKELNSTIEMALYKHRMEIKLKESEARFKGLVENSSIGIFRIDSEGKILHANPTFVNLLGYKNFNEIKNNKFENYIIGGAEKYSEILDEINEKKQIARCQFEIKIKDKENIFVSLNGKSFDQGIDDTYFDGTIEDITIQLKYEDQLIKAKEIAEQADQIKSDFLAGMSHEIRTPINTILNYSSLLSEELKKNENNNYDDIFTSIQLGSKRLIRTIDSILNMAQLQAGSFNVFKTKINLVEEVFNNLLEEFNFLAEKKGIDLNLNVVAEHTNILGDQYSLKQLFISVIDNSLKYTEQGDININIYNDAEGTLSIAIEDTGKSLPEDLLNNFIENSVEQVDKVSNLIEGNGLCLSLIKKYCEINGAFLKVTNKKGGGTKYTVKFDQTKIRNKSISNNVEKTRSLDSQDMR